MKAMYWGVSVFLLGGVLPVCAEPLIFNADHVSFDMASHQGDYRGHVSLTQGKHHLESENAQTQLDKTQHLRYAKAFSTESPAHFWTHMHPNDPVFHAYARSIEYFPAKQLLILSDHASIQQGKFSLQAPVIQYNLATHKVITEPRDNEKTRILFHIDPAQANAISQQPVDPTHANIISQQPKEEI